MRGSNQLAVEHSAMDAVTIVAAEEERGNKDTAVCVRVPSVIRVVLEGWYSSHSSRVRMRK